MRLYYYAGERGITNFGTLLNDHLPPAERTVVFGPGVGYYCLPASAAITDPGILVPNVFDRAPAPGAAARCSFMPHWQTEPSAWAPLCEEAGLGFIDPRWEPTRVVDAIRRSDVVLSEAMHGATAADAFRVPWLPIRTRDTIKGFRLLRRVVRERPTLSRDDVFRNRLDRMEERLDALRERVKRAA